MTTLRALAGALMVLATFAVAVAKLPAPPPMTDAQKVAAEEKKAKDAAAAETRQAATGAGGRSGRLALPCRAEGEGQHHHASDGTRRRSSDGDPCRGAGQGGRNARQGAGSDSAGQKIRRSIATARAAT